jgi:hypothetical protein
MAIGAQRHHLVEFGYDWGTRYRVRTLSKRIEVVNFDISLTSGPVPFSKIQSAHYAPHTETLYRFLSQARVLLKNVLSR